MPAGGGKIGNKGGGRKSARDEFAKNQAIKKAWEKVNKEIDDHSVEKIALPIALKDMAVKNDIAGSLAIVQITGMEISQDENDAIKIQDKDNKTASGNASVA